MTATTVVGVLLVAPVAAVAVETVGFRRGPFDAAFWRLPLDQKLDRIAARRTAWWQVTAPWFATLALLDAGLAGLAYLLADAIGWAGFGAFTIAAAAWLCGAALQGGAIVTAAGRRAATGATPDWTAAVWAVGGLLEIVWIIVGNLAAAAYAVAVVRTDLLPHWLGWVCLVVAPAVAAVVAIAREGFPHLAMLIPMVFGVALLFA